MAQRWDMSQGAFDQAAKGTAGRTQDLGGLVKQLVQATVESRFSKAAQDVLKDHRAAHQHDAGQRPDRTQAGSAAVDAIPH